ncbi:MAG: hypothetical protein LBU26_07055, partial [Synergistaceae bacterium]|nr:hypothetical protein [Synergistaceae bacterium]
KIRSEMSGPHTGVQTEPPSEVEEMRATQKSFWDFLFENLTLRNFLNEYARLVQFARLVFICALIVIITVVCLNIKRNLWSFSRARKLEFERGGASGDMGAAARMETASVEADDLARSGSFAEAMHVLLLRSVSEMRGRLDSPIAESLTSREILRRPDLSPEERDVFATIVGGVEISYFGPHHPGEEEYSACRKSFDALAGLLRRGRAG